MLCCVLSGATQPFYSLEETDRAATIRWIALRAMKNRHWVEILKTDLQKKLKKYGNCRNFYNFVIIKAKIKRN